MLMTGLQVRQARKDAGMSQRQLAAILKVHPNNLCNFELGRSESWHLRVKATEYFQQSAKELRGVSC